MKVIRFENGNLTFYLHKRDVQILQSISDFVPQEIFKDKAIESKECDENGYYKITSLDAIRAINSLPFIPEYTELDNMSVSDLTTLSLNADRLYMAIQHTLDDHFVEQLSFDSDSYNAIREYATIVTDNLLVRFEGAILAEDYDDSKYIRECINQQIRCYNYSVRETANRKTIEEQKRIEAEKEAKKLTLKKVISKLKRQ